MSSTKTTVESPAADEDQPGNSEKSRRRHEISGKSEAVLKSGNFAAYCIKVSRRMRAAGSPPGDEQGYNDESDKNADRSNVDATAHHWSPESVLVCDEQSRLMTRTYTRDNTMDKAMMA